MFDLNNCTIEYIKNGRRQKTRAVRHLSGKDAEDLNSYIIVSASSKMLGSNTTNDSFYKYITAKFKNDPDKHVLNFSDLLESYKKTMPAVYLQELEGIEAKHKSYIQDSKAISENAQAFEILNGKHIYFSEIKIPTENFVIRKVDKQRN